jgi:hypothetical protein
MWAIRQSPYNIPDNLDTAIRKFQVELSKKFPIYSDIYAKLDFSELRDLIVKTFPLVPEIERWNVPKKGTHKNVYTSAFYKPKADYDFIDLDALARNTAHSLSLERENE